ncbi:protein mono-ADP-ribosyltransferase PARP9 [Cheilinus undulatus]|uniref:protein mono-ADP-ribosyltransferase PARP9 n=1 Tax=Cheilinus undulatus TaxID=241271 RepID=UPI001BD3F4B5|nr:protein mono-ADP-ribosyltransferase PARP9 [Cheilinus undulatus]
MNCKLDVPLHGDAVSIVKQNRKVLCDVLQSKFGCVAVLEGFDSDDEFSMALQKKALSEDQPRFAVKLPSGVQVSVWKSDLTIFKADAVVNAANSQLQHYGGLALALSEAGGSTIQKESEDYIKKKGELKTGDAIVADPGLLPYKCIIHAVGPRVPYSSTPNLSQAEPLLKNTIWSILDRVTQHRLQSVAIPAISSGIYSYPLPECANTIVSTVKNYCQKYSAKHLPDEIFLVNHDEPTVQEMHRACHHILAPHLPMSYSQAAGSKSGAQTRTSTLSLKIGEINLMLKKGNIEDERTDVIVNTASQDKNLSMGAISSALLSKAGFGMQDEIRRAPQTGPITITDAYNLGCKKVFHTFCSDKRGHQWQLSWHEVLLKSVSECLWMAVTNKHKSIAFPAIGTGNLGFDKKEVAEIITTAVFDFAQKSASALDVHVVIFPSDNSTFQAFEEQIKKLKEKMSHPSFKVAFYNGSNSHGVRAPSPQISLTGPSDEATREADRWLQNLLFEAPAVVPIHNNFILHFGEQEQRQLSDLTKSGVSIEEYFANGRARIIVRGDSKKDVAVARLRVEAILCKIHEEFARDEEREIFQQLTKNVSSRRETMHALSTETQYRHSVFKDLWISKVEKLENTALEMLFDLKKKQLNCSTTHTMFQCMPAQFLDLVSRVGFHTEFAPPKDPMYGEGIYFARTVKKAMETWKGQMKNEEYIYFVEAEVLMGSFTPGKPGLILPHAGGADPHKLYDSVSGGSDISVIFSGYQALPRYIITCQRPKTS